MTRDFIDYIYDIVNSIEEIADFIQNIDYETFSEDRKTINAVIRSLEVMGEAATNIPQNIKEKYSEIPWKRMTGMRNKLIHQYFGVDNEIVWEVCAEEIPPLKPFFQKLLRDLSS